MKRLFWQPLPSEKGVEKEGRKACLLAAIHSTVNYTLLRAGWTAFLAGLFRQPRLPFTSSSHSFANFFCLLQRRRRRKKRKRKSLQLGNGST